METREPREPGPAHYRQHLNRLRHQGRALEGDSDLSSDGPELRAWQQECATLVGQLSGGTKSHWLARAFSDAFLVTPSQPGAVTTEVSAKEIVARILAVLDLAGESLQRLERGEPSGTSGPVADRFAFIADPTLRMGLAEVDRVAQEALARGAYALALVGTCSVLESVITERIQRQAPTALAEHGAPAGPITSWPFDARIAVAERLGCVSAGCARLPSSGRRYRELLDPNGDVRDAVRISEQDARRARQVLRVILRDLAPGR